MQAGESLHFLTTPEELDVPERTSVEQKEAILNEFLDLFDTMLTDNASAFRKAVREEEFGGISVVEGSLQVLYVDGSYVHIVPYCYIDQSEGVDVGMSVVEHDETGNLLGGYLFEILTDNDSDVKEVMYAKHVGIDLSGEDLDEEEKKYHFSPIGLFENKDQMSLLLQSENEAERFQAEEDQRALDEIVSLSMMEADLKFVYSPLVPEELEKLKLLVSQASPFNPLHEHNF